MYKYEDAAKWYASERKHGNHDFMWVDVETWMVPEKDKFVVMHQMKRLAVLDKDNTYTLVRKTPSTRDCLRLTAITGVSIWYDKYHHPNKKQHIRVAPKRTYGGASLPYTSGLKVRNREIINSEIAVEYVRRTKRKKAKAIREQMKPLIDLAKGLIRMEAVKEVHRYQYNGREIKLDPPTADSAEALIARGCWYHYSANTQESQQNALASGIRSVRRELYQKHNVYYYERLT